MPLITLYSYAAYKPRPLRPLEEIRADILALDRETEGLLAEIVAGPACCREIKE